MTNQNLPFTLNLPPEYPELLEQMGQIIARTLLKRMKSENEVRELSIEIIEGLRRDLSGANLYIPRGLKYDLSVRDAEIYEKFNGNNYHELVHMFKMTEMQIRSICKRGLLRDRALRQRGLF